MSEPDDWAVRGRWAWLHGLRVLDPARDATFDRIVSLTSRTIGGPVSLWLRDGPEWVLSAAGAGAPAAAGETGNPEDLVDLVDLVEDVTFAGLPVGEVRVAVRSTDLGAARSALAAAAAEVVVHLDERLALARRDRGRPVGVLVTDEALAIRWWSPDVDELARGETAGWTERTALDLVAPNQSEWAAPLASKLQGGRGRSASMRVRLVLSAAGEGAFELEALNRLDDPDTRALAFVIREQREDDDGSFRILGDQMWVLNRLSTSQPVGETLERVVELVEHRRPDATCVIMGWDAARERLDPLVGPRFPAGALDAITSIPVGPDQPAGGASLHYDMPQFVNDLRQDASWGDRSAPVAAEGFRACWSLPITSVRDGRRLGSLDVYLHNAGQPSETDSRVLLMAARLAALAIDQDAHERELWHAARHDPLTELPNRTLFAERLADAASEGGLAVLFLDLDRFKLVNDTLGHEFGDDLLRAVADRLAAAVAPPATIARFGGDEFTVLLPSVDQMAVAVAEADRLLAIVGEPYRVRGQNVVIRASAGVAVSGGDGGEGRAGDPSSLVRDADAALYHAKDRGRGHVEAFDDRLLVAAGQRLDLERLLLDALDAGLLEVLFQPSIRLADGVVVGVEALARCRSATGALVSPLQFIPVAEETGLIGRVFDAVLAESCRTALRWNDAGAGRLEPLTVWVNLSPSQLGSPDLLGQVTHAFDRSGVDPSLIGFEVTERGILADPDEARERLAALVALGAHAALDDFGTGHSSLSHLQELPVDTVKLDRSFVVRAEVDARSAAIVGGVVGLAASMGLRCVAEGVETAHELAVIAALGCDIVQGFVYCRPCPADALTTWLATPVAPFTPTPA